MKMPVFFTLIILVVMLTACRKNEPEQINFYYWKSEVKLGSTEISYFKLLHAQKLYIRLFDIDNEGVGAFPKSKIKPFNANVLKANYVPVIFITNRTFLHLSENENETLALKTKKLIEEICRANSIQHSEIQIDCDWTPSTGKAYFRFLEQLKQLSGKTISCTIRLHQVKDAQKCGVPPVDKGVLMCYATANPRETNQQNSILDLKLLRRYLQNIDSYTLPMDMALPLYSWAVVRNHLGKIKLVNGVSNSEMKDMDGIEPIGQNRYRLKKDLVFHDLYLNQGFEIRIEEISPELIAEARKILSKTIKQHYNLIYYHLDSLFLQKFSVEQLK